MKGYTDNPNVKAGYYSDQVTPGLYQITMGAAINLDANGNIQDTNPSSLVGQAVTGLPMAPDAEITEINGNILKIKSASKADFEINLKINGMGGATSVNITNMELNITGMGAMTMQTGAQEGQILDIRIPTVSLEELGIKNLDMSTMESSQEGIDSIKGAISYISSVRSRLGAYQNRLDHTISNLDITDENMTAAYSRIMDVDMAEEMTEYTTMQVISQASMSMLAQANERPAQVLQLLQ